MLASDADSTSVWAMFMDRQANGIDGSTYYSFSVCMCLGDPCFELLCGSMAFRVRVSPREAFLFEFTKPFLEGSDWSDRQAFKNVMKARHHPHSTDHLHSDEYGGRAYNGQAY